jgi:hypothetical protein
LWIWTLPVQRILRRFSDNLTLKKELRKVFPNVAPTALPPIPKFLVPYRRSLPLVCLSVSLSVIPISVWWRYSTDIWYMTTCTS